MPSPPWTDLRIPVVAVLCGLVFALYGVSPGQAISLHCQAPQADTQAPHCQVQQGRRLGWLPKQTSAFDWIDLTMTSRLCDNDPRGGVRFCHRLTLIGENRQVTLSERRTLLSAEAVHQTLHRFMAGQGGSDFAWSTPQPWLDTLHSLLLALLLSITAWGFGSWRWPSDPPLPLDGLDDLTIPKKD